MKIKYFNEELICKINYDIVSKFNGVYGLRDNNALSSAISSIFLTFDSIELFPTIIDKAAKLGFELIKQHPFIDGNKRIGAHIMILFLKVNNIDIEYSQKDLYSIIMDIASSIKFFNDLKEWILKRIIK